MSKVVIFSINGDVERHQKAQAIWPTVGLTLFICARCTLPFLAGQSDRLPMAPLSEVLTRGCLEKESSCLNERPGKH